MDQRPEESTREYAERLVESGDPNASVEFSVTLSASTILSAVEGMPTGTSPQEAIRARLLMANMQDEMWGVSVSSVTSELDEIEDQLEDLVGVVAASADCESYAADVNLEPSNTE